MQSRWHLWPPWFLSGGTGITGDPHCPGVRGVHSPDMWPMSSKPRALASPSGPSPGLPAASDLSSPGEPSIRCTKGAQKSQGVNQ